MDTFARLLKESWTLVEEDRVRLTEHFYARTFLLDPELRKLFPVQMSGQGDRLLEAIIAAIHTVDDPEGFDEFLRALGRDHRKYHVDAAHYDTMGEALLDALRCTAGDGWNLAYDQAWRDAYAAIVEKMLAGAAADTNPAFWHAEVLTHERFGSDTAVFTCRALQHPLSWKAGQYVSIEAPRYHPRVWRTYSVANAPNDDNVLEFHIRTPAGAGWLSGALVRRLQPGDLLRVAAPMGSMTLDRSSERDILCVAGGVGLAPIKALLEELTSFNLTRWVHVFYGAHTKADLYGLDGLRELVAAHPWLSVTPACSDDPDFDGEQGEITDVVARYGPWTAHDCYVSGSAPMVRSTLRVLAADEVLPQRIRYDTFGNL
ncbi:globin domain-containing protein [Micromonospora endophytica]|uniref:nitric oxide dioxygenase n=1 Tax=Micromonospora endophytica TaxID=515350 RepID=A0A2W2CP13_9ACTN|nr:globin domain-containing protein [Micromonospora endophytica]PZF89807.1 flavohemoprotein [Micromonospora endophytica]RIW45211.1 flavohemoprotein [Micromonospora endophytica]BCJ59575.1 flavohemoprotein [Micromonospora endophytica]